LSHLGPTVSCSHQAIMDVFCTSASPVTFLALPSPKQVNGLASSHVQLFEEQSVAIQKLHEKTSRTSPGDM